MHLILHHTVWFFFSGDLELSLFKWQLPSLCWGHWCWVWSIPFFCNAVKRGTWEEIDNRWRFHTWAQQWPPIQYVLCFWQRWRAQGKAPQGFLHLPVESSFSFCFPFVFCKDKGHLTSQLDQEWQVFLNVGFDIIVFRCICLTLIFQGRSHSRSLMFSLLGMVPRLLIQVVATWTWPLYPSEHCKENE